MVQQLGTDLQAALDAHDGRESELVRLKLLRAQVAVDLLAHQWNDFLVANQHCKCGPPRLLAERRDSFIETTCLNVDRALRKHGKS